MSAPSTDDRGTGPDPRRPRRRFLPLLLLVAALALAWALGLQRFLDLDALAERRVALAELVVRYPVLAPAGFVAAYVVVVALSLPGAVVMTLAGGLLFGAAPGAALAVLGATAGACLLFVAARAALASSMERRGGRALQRAIAALRREGFLYLLTLRLLPVVPFWLVNLAGALAGMRLLPFAAATAVGIVPGTAVFASIGAGLGGVLDAGRRPDLSTIFSAPVLLPLCALAALSLAGAWWRGRHGRTQ